MFEPLLERALRVFAIVIAVSACGCRATVLLPSEVAAAWQRSCPEAVAWRQIGRVRLDSEAISGSFRGACVLRHLPTPAVRLQLFPEVGGKVLDLAADETGFAGYFPQAARGVSHVWDEGPAPRHVLTFMAITLLERARGSDPERALAVWPEGTGWTVELQPLHVEAQVTLDVNARGEVLAKHFELRGARWTETVSEGGTRIEGKGFVLELEIESTSPAEDLPDALFHLELPPGVTR
ncbi:MAG: hypothetical protein RL885_20170 [Planctomycetota bacterium]